MRGRVWPADKKFAIVLEGLTGTKPVAQICREHQIAQTQYYQWRARVLEGGQRALLNGLPASEAALQRKIERLERRFRQQARVIKRVTRTRRGRRAAMKLVKGLRRRGWAVAVACRLLGVSRSGYYAAQQVRPAPVPTPDPAEEAFLARVRAITQAHPRWGYRRVWAWLRYREGLRVNKKRVYRVMREAGLTVTWRRRRRPGLGRPGGSTGRRD
jgi:transposase-like protein